MRCGTSSARPFSKQVGSLQGFTGPGSDSHRINPVCSNPPKEFPQLRNNQKHFSAELLHPFSLAVVLQMCNFWGGFGMFWIFRVPGTKANLQYVVVGHNECAHRPKVFFVQAPISVTYWQSNPSNSRVQSSEMALGSATLCLRRLAELQPAWFFRPRTLRKMKDPCAKDNREGCAHVWGRIQPHSATLIDGTLPGFPKRRRGTAWHSIVKKKKAAACHLISSANTSFFSSSNLYSRYPTVSFQNKKLLPCGVR